MENTNKSKPSHKKLYCICRSTDCKSFMIGCDQCEEWFHGKCINITPIQASKIKRYYCTLCRHRDSSLKIRYKKHKRKDVESRNNVDGKEKQKRRLSLDEGKSPIKKKKKNATKASYTKSNRQCGECINCKLTEDCGKCDFCKDMKKFGGPNKIRQKCRHRQCVNLGLRKGFDAERNVIPAAPKLVPAPVKKTPRQQKKKIEKKTLLSRNRQVTQVKSENERILLPVEPQQCLGPRCVQAARAASKYCSDDCGMKLAAQRLVEIMPQRIEQWQATPCLAEEKNRREMDENREQILESKRRLDALDEKHRKLDKIVERGKELTVTSDSEDEEEEVDMFMYCVSCGMEINQRGAIKHMEKCFVKFEREMSFGGAYKSIIGGDTICDHYNAQSKTYCKRLKVICPEHSREPRISEEEVCGCPITKNVFEETVDLCRNSKKYCTQHFKWEKLRRAEIDTDKIRQWFRIEELIEKQRLIRASMENRAGVLGLLLHQTVDHSIIQTKQRKLVTKETPIKEQPPTKETSAKEQLLSLEATGHDYTPLTLADKPRSDI